MDWALKLIIASSVIALDTTGAPGCILGRVVFTKATGNESKGWSRGLIYVGHTGSCISKVESCTDATIAASIFPPSQLRIYVIWFLRQTPTTGYNHLLQRRRHAAATITPITLYSKIINNNNIHMHNAYGIPTTYYIMYLYIYMYAKLYFSATTKCIQCI